MEQRTCQNCKNPFTIEPDDFSFYEKMGVSAPVNCPECRFRWRALFRNEMHLYNRACALCGKAIVAMHHPASPYTVYCRDCWLSERWDPASYAQDYDQDRPFFEQMGELLRRVPKAGIFASEDLGPNVNSDYINFAGSCKNCYLVFNSSPEIEDSAYSRGLSFCRDVFDSYYADKVERAYEAINVHTSANVVWTQNTNDSLDSWYLLNCSGCQHCFGCVNLRRKSYHFLNQPLTKDEYAQKVDEIRGSYARTEAFRKQFNELALRLPRRENNNLKSLNSTGDCLFETKNCRDSFEVSFCEDSRYLFGIKYAKDCYDLLGHGRKGELLLDNVAVGTSTNVLGSWWVISSHDVAYSFALRSCEYCFGCDSLRAARYCILNKQYTEEEYRRVRERIVSELKAAGLYGLYFPPQIALFAYNETVGQDNLPLTKEEALKFGFRWQDDLQMTRGKETLVPERIPDHIRDVTDTITKEVLACVDCGRNYRIIPPELQFYRTITLPIPRRCFFCRHADRLRRRGPMKMYDRACTKCGVAIKTTFAPDRPEIIYCESCYNVEVV